MARTVTIQPIQTSRLDMGHPDLYPINEDGLDEDTPTSPRSPYQDYPMYPGLQQSSSSSTARIPGTPPPTALNTPRKLSNGSTASSTNSTMYSRESIRSELQRSSSWGSKTSFDSFDCGSPWRAEFPPQPLRRRRTHPQVDEQFAALPGEVLQLVLAMLKELHLARRSDSCATCWMRDLCSISLASRRWCKYARVAL